MLQTPPASVSGQTLKGSMFPSYRQRNKACETADTDRVKTSTVIDGVFCCLFVLFSIGAPKPGPTHARQVPCPGLHLPFHQSSYSNLDISLQMLPVQTSDTRQKYSLKLNHCREKMFLVCSLNTLIPLNCCVAFNLFEYNAKSIFQNSSVMYQEGGRAVLKHTVCKQRLN